MASTTIHATMAISMASTTVKKMIVIFFSFFLNDLLIAVSLLRVYLFRLNQYSLKAL